jgi:hypothetical protein
VEAARLSETSVSTRETTRRHKKEDLDLNLQRRENFYVSQPSNLIPRQFVFPPHNFDQWTDFHETGF